MDPATMAALLKAAADAKRALDTAALRREVEHIKTAVDAIGMQLDEDVLTQGGCRNRQRRPAPRRIGPCPRVLRAAGQPLGRRQGEGNLRLAIRR